MGSLHQSAIVPTTRYLSKRIRQNPFPPVCLHPGKSDLFRQTRMIWHRTYPAPDWLFGQPLTDSQTSIETFNLGGKWTRLWELLVDSAQVPIDQAQTERSVGSHCDAWYLASNNTLQRYSLSSVAGFNWYRTFVIAPLSAVLLDESIVDPSSDELVLGRDWGLFPVWKVAFHINLDDVDLNKESLVETVTRVVGRHGLGVWLLVSI